MAHFDLIIRGGQVIDGSGAAAARLDVGIDGDRITAIDQLEQATAASVIDAAGKIVSPGFIDVHVHSEIALLGGQHRYGGLYQGVTTQLMAPDGFGWAPLAPELARQLWECTLFSIGPTELTINWPTIDDYLALFTNATPANLALQVPHCAVRLAAMGWAARAATSDELARMKELTRQWLEAGAVCLNLGLDYQPSAYADTRELIELCRVARGYDAIYAAHIRYTDLGQVEAWRETMAIGQAADIPVHISHESVTDITAPLLDEAAARCDLTFESYLYPAGCTHLALMLPVWAQAGGLDGLRQRLRDPVLRRRMGDHLQQTLAESIAQGARPVFAVTQTGRFIGQTLDEAAAGRPIGEFALQILEEEDPYALMIFHRGWSEATVERVTRATLQHPRMMVASDGVYHGGFGHPRGYGCFARVLRLGVREMAAVSLPEAIYKMTGLPAARFRLRDRGLLRTGYGADLVIFDPDSVADQATWQSAWRPPVGIDHVLVNGRPVVANGQPTGDLPGRILRY